MFCNPLVCKAGCWHAPPDTLSDLLGCRPYYFFYKKVPAKYLNRKSNPNSSDIIYIGIDDTDSTSGMCTTYLATELIRRFDDLDLIGNPRLVRLNPNVPWKTRGNGAISLLFGKGRGSRKKVGSIDGEDVHAHYFGENTPAEESHFSLVREIVEEFAVFDDEKTNPGVVIYDLKPERAFYKQAVRGIVRPDGLKMLAQPTFSRGYKNGRGLIGATAAVAWRPGDRTYELIAYRAPEMWGKKRDIDEASVMAMDKKFYSTFNNYDYEEKHMAIAPSSPCPVLFGIRGDREDALPGAMRSVKSEKPDRWLIFMTNQGTDDHISEARIGTLQPFTSVKTTGTVVSEPRMLEGGHLVFRIAHREHEADCTIYEPAKDFRKVGEKLLPGDVVTVFGGVREEPFTVNVEKLKIERLVTVREKTANPMCQDCGKRMKSAGSGQGYRCALCGRKAAESEAEFGFVRRGLEEGQWHQPTVSALRHLSKPLKRMGLK